MNTCPKCHGQLNGDFGMVVCPTCQAAVFFDMDGNPHVGDESQQEVIGDTNSEQAADISQVSSEVAFTDSNIDSNFESYIDMNVLESKDAVSTLDTFDSSLEDAIYQPPQTASLQKFDDVTEFANSNLESGALLYDIRIEGIDLAEIRYEVFEELQDSKLALDLDVLQDSIVDGVLEIKSINPIKASVIIRRIRNLPIQITWRQYAISQNA